MTSDRQRGFSLLIGLILLAGMSLLAVSLVQRGLLDTRFAYRAMEGVADFQQQDGAIEAQLGNQKALIEAHIDRPCGSFSSVKDSALEIHQVCPSSTLAPPSPQAREHLARLYATSYGASGNQQLSHYRYFELRAEPSPDSGGEPLYQGIMSLATGGQ